jgi:hypothetical protein
MNTMHLQNKNSTAVQLLSHHTVNELLFPINARVGVNNIFYFFATSRTPHIVSLFDLWEFAGPIA